MTVKTTLSFTDRHHEFLARQVGEGIFATTSAAVAAAVERLIDDEEERQAMLGAMADEIRERLKTPPEEFVPFDEAMSQVRERIAQRSRD